MVQDIWISYMVSRHCSYISLNHMLEVLSAVTGQSIAAVDETALADNSVKALKQYLAQQLGIPRFRLRLLHYNEVLRNEDSLDTLQVVQLVFLDFLPHDTEQEGDIMVACEENNRQFLEQYLNEPRSPNFTAALNAMTPLYRACAWGALDCVSLLIEAGANIEHGLRSETPLQMAAAEGHLEVVRFLLESGADVERGRAEDGATSLIVAATCGYLDIVRCLVESGANKDRACADDGQTPLWGCSLRRTLRGSSVFTGVRCE